MRANRANTDDIRREDLVETDREAVEIKVVWGDNPLAFDVMRRASDCVERWPIEPWPRVHFEYGGIVVDVPAEARGFIETQGVRRQLAELRANVAPWSRGGTSAHACRLRLGDCAVLELGSFTVTLRTVHPARRISRGVRACGGALRGQFWTAISCALALAFVVAVHVVPGAPKPNAGFLQQRAFGYDLIARIQALGERATLPASVHNFATRTTPPRPMSFVGAERSGLRDVLRAGKNAAEAVPRAAEARESIAPPQPSTAPPQPRAAPRGETGGTPGRGTLHAGPMVVIRDIPDERNLLPKETIRHLVRTRLDEIENCTRRFAGAASAEPARLTVQFSIAPYGGVASSQVVMGNSIDPEIEQCIVNTINNWVFPAPEVGNVLVTYRFVRGAL